MVKAPHFSWDCFLCVQFVTIWLPLEVSVCGYNSWLLKVELKQNGTIAVRSHFSINKHGHQRLTNHTILSHAEGSKSLAQALFQDGAGDTNQKTNWRDFCYKTTSLRADFAGSDGPCRVLQCLLCYSGKFRWAEHDPFILYLRREDRMKHWNAHSSLKHRMNLSPFENLKSARP